MGLNRIAALATLQGGLPTPLGTTWELSKADFGIFTCQSYAMYKIRAHPNFQPDPKQFGAHASLSVSYRLLLRGGPR